MIFCMFISSRINFCLNQYVNNMATTHMIKHHEKKNLNLFSGLPVSGRILVDIPCKVCQDHSSGKHYGIYACDG